MTLGDIAFDNVLRCSTLNNDNSRHLSKRQFHFARLKCERTVSLIADVIIVIIRLFMIEVYTFDIRFVNEQHVIARTLECLL